MGKSINNDESLRGQRFGKLTIIGFEKIERKWGGTTTFKWNWICRCDCGNIISANPHYIRRGDTKSCGCLKREKIIEYNKTAKVKHGGKNTKLYAAWSGMKSRCYNKRDRNYAQWGGRGITVCDEWKDNFSAFREWAENNGFEESLTLDRINVDGNYDPNNCRWCDWKEQARNKTTTQYVVFNGEQKTLAELAEKYGIPYGTLYSRINYYGWDLERALTEERYTGQHRR